MDISIFQNEPNMQIQHTHTIHIYIHNIYDAYMKHLRTHTILNGSGNKININIGANKQIWKIFTESTLDPIFRLCRRLWYDTHLQVGIRMMKEPRNVP